MIYEAYSFSLCLSFFHRIDSSLWSQPLYMLLLRLTKLLRGRRLNFVFSLRFMIRPYKVIKIFVQMQASSFLFFHVFWGSLMSDSVRHILTADG